MPELPEVQTVINYLKNNILNLKIKNIEIKNKKFLKNINSNLFKEKLINNKIIDIQRIGKYLIFVLSNNNKIVVHLRMEGKFFIDDVLKNRKHDYIIFELENGKYLSYNDSRQFGTFHLTKDEKELKEINKIAIDPLDEKFNYDYFYKRIQNSKKNIKALLLDQTIVSGIGNIYASEILFDAKISPYKIGKELNKNEIKEIVESSKKILKLALKNKGTTIHSFLFTNDQEGNYAKFLKVMNREGQNCFICNNKIIRIKQQSRSTFYCSYCQK